MRHRPLRWAVWIAPWCFVCMCVHGIAVLVFAPWGIARCAVLFVLCTARIGVLLTFQHRGQTFATGTGSLSKDLLHFSRSGSDSTAQDKVPLEAAVILGHVLPPGASQGARGCSAASVDCQGRLVIITVWALSCILHPGEASPAVLCCLDHIICRLHSVHLRIHFILRLLIFHHCVGLCRVRN